MINFGKRIEPLVDRYLIEEMHGCDFRGETPQCIAKALGFDEAWENPGSVGVSVFEDDGIVKMYYRGWPEKLDAMCPADQAACLAVSRDGIHFERAAINRLDYHGIRENNIVRLGHECHMFAPFLDENPDCRPGERYKAIAGRTNLGLMVYASEDGIDFHPLADDYVIKKGVFDSLNIAFWDKIAKIYRCYSRYRITNADGRSYRAIQSCTSEDFIHWTEPIGNVYDDMEHYSEELYTNAATSIPGAEHVLVCMPMRFWDERMKVPEFDKNPFSSKGVSDLLFMTSRDGVKWDRTLNEPYLTPGLYRHEWTQRNFIASAGIIERGDMFYLYIEKHYLWEDDGMYVYALPRYRFIGLHTDKNGGRILTRPLHFETDEFYLNYATSAYGSVTVRVIGADGRVSMESEPIFGNEISHRVELPGLAGTDGRLELILKEATLYAIGSDMAKK